MVSVRTKYYTRAGETRANFDGAVSDVAPYCFTETIELGPDGLAVDFQRSATDTDMYRQTRLSMATLSFMGVGSSMQLPGVTPSLTLAPTTSIHSKVEPDPERIPVGM